MAHTQESKKKKEYRPENDLYPTPKCLVRKLVETGELHDLTSILEPACGNNAIVDILKEYGFNVTGRDITTGNDFLKDDYSNSEFDAIVTNPPFCLYDDFVKKAKTINCKKIIMIGRLNLLGAHKRNINGFWNELSDIYVFDRQIAYDQPAREDEKASTGMLVSGWFIWTKGYKKYPRLHIIDIQDCIAKKSK